MIPDHALIAAAQKLAGRHIHTVAQRLTVYEMGFQLLAASDQPQANREVLSSAVLGAELWLRSFVARERVLSHVSCGHHRNDQERQDDARGRPGA